MKHGVLPLLLGFLLLGGAAPSAHHGRATRQSAPAAPQSTPAATQPRLLRTADEMRMQPIEPLPVYLVQPEDLRVVAIQT